MKPIIVITGDGKGKSTAAFGLLVRTLGHGLKAGLVQFMKSGVSGETEFFKAGTDIDVHVGGLGFYRGIDRDNHRAAAAKTMAIAGKWLSCGTYSLVVCDEILYAVKDGLVTEAEMMKLIDCRHSDTAMVLTGRGASPELIARADYATECLCLKHPYSEGRKPGRAGCQPDRVGCQPGSTGRQPMRGIEF